MIKRLATRRKCSTFWHKPIRGKGLCCYVDANNDGYFANNERVSQFDYFLDWLGRKDNAVETFWIDGFENKNLIDWNYDNAGRLIQEVFDHYDNAFDQTQEWEYDLVGNRLVQKLDKGNDSIYEAITNYTYDANDRLITELFDDLTEADKDKETLYGYTHTQQTSKTVSEKTDGKFVKQNETTFEYDAQGRMSVVTITAGGRVERTVYEYGADGIRTSATQEIYVDGIPVSKTRTEYLNDSQNITGYSQVLKQTETDSEGNIIKEISYVIGHQRISQTVKENNTETTHYFTFDGHGSTRALVDFAGAVVQLYSFDAYGNALGFNTNEALTEFLYSGEQFDSKIGQQYLRARYYDPATGRFNRLDPFFGNLNDPQSLHKYTYTHNNPINGVDPSGEMLGAMISVGINFAMNGIKNGATIVAGTTVITTISGFAVGGIAGAYFSNDENALLADALRGAGLGAYYGSVIGSSLSLGYVLHGNNWSGVWHVLKGGMLSGLIRGVTEILWELRPYQQNLGVSSDIASRVAMKIIDSTVMGMWNTATSEWFPSCVQGEVAKGIIGAFDSVLMSVGSDLLKNPQPTPQQIAENATTVFCIELSKRLVNAAWMNSADSLLTFDTALQPFWKIVTSVLTAFEAKAVTGFFDSFSQ